jgi:uncharacterized membrane protein YkgB
MTNNRFVISSVKLQMAGALVLRYSLVFFLLFFGALKWTLAEARGIEPLVSHSPLLAWTGRFGMRGSSELIGIIELAIGALIALRRWSPKLSAWGSIGASGMFLVTLSFLFTTPNLGEGAPFLIKDICLLGAALWTAGEALQAKEAAR